jgi:hypothetical protein
MKTLILLSFFFSFSNLWDIISLLLAIFALIISFGFALRPRISCDIYNEKNKIKVKLFNNNKFRKLITDINCEMALSDGTNFTGKVYTLDLVKDCIVCLRRSKGTEIDQNYVFKQKEIIHQPDKNHIRIRFLLSNFIGVKKTYEVIVPFDEFQNQKIHKILKKPK